MAAAAAHPPAVRFEERAAQSTDGTRLVALHLPCTSDPPPSTRPLLMVHGTFTVAEEWLPVASMLARHRPIAILERRARGRSGDSECALPHSLALEAADVAAMVQMLGGDVDLFGHSFGGAVVAQYAIDSQHTGALVLFDPGSGMNGPLTTPEQNESVLRLLRDDKADDALELCLTTVNGLPAHVLPLLRAVPPLWTQMKHLLVSNLREVLSLTSFAPSSSELSRIRGRTHLLLSDLAGDGLRRMAGEWVARHIGVSLAPLRGVGHTAYLEQPQLVADGVQQALLASSTDRPGLLSTSARPALSEPVDVGQDPFHKPILHNEWVRVLDVRIPAAARSLFHTHSEQSVYVYLTPSVVTSQAYGAEDAAAVTSTCVPGATRFEPHDTVVYTHRVANLSDETCRTYDIELLRRRTDGNASSAPPTFAELPSQAQVVWQEARARMVTLLLPAGERCHLSRHDRPVLLIGLAGEMRVSMRVADTDANASLVDADSSPAGAVSSHLRWADLRYVEAGSTQLCFANDTAEPAEARILQFA